MCCLAQGSVSIMTDKDFFDALNLDYPGLQEVRESVNKGNYRRAKDKYVTYIKNRKTPKWYFDWRDFSSPSNRNPKAKTGYADRYANNELLSCGVWYKFGDKIDWTSNHSGNNYEEWTWQLNRLHCWTTLGEAYWETGNEKYARAFVSQLNSWIDQCPVPTKSWNGVGSAWRTLDAGIRMMGNWPNAFYRFLSSGSFDDESVLKMVKSFYEHGKHLRQHHTERSDNWQAVEMCGLYTVGAMFPEFMEAEEWRTYAVETLYEQEASQFYPDGAQQELAPGYHALSGSSIVSIYKLARLNSYKLPSGFVERLEMSYEYYQKIMLPDGTLPAVNDSKWVDAEKYLKEAYELFPDRKDFRYFATARKQGRKPKYTSVWMPWAGWYVMRTGWNKDAMYAFFEAGPYGAAHQHEDKLSFILYAYGSTLITECGTYAYDASEWRKYTTSARGHNVARIDGMDQNRNALRSREEVKISKQPLANTWESTRRYDYGEGQYVEGYGPKLDKTVTHRRSLRMVKNKYWVVTDTFVPSDTKPHTYDTWFHFGTSSYGEDKRLNIIYSKNPEGANIAIVRLSEGGTYKVICGQTELEIQGWLPAAGGENGFHCEPAATPVYHTQGHGIIKETYVFIPYQAGEGMPVREVKKLSENKYRLNLQNGERYTVNIN